MSTTAQFATTTGVRIAFETRGDGEPLLLIHGLGYTRAGWGPALDLLAETHRVISFDNRGVGESEIPPGPYTVAAMAGDAVAVLDAAGVPQADVVGTSLGGMIAQELVLAHPERVRRLVLACTHPGGERAYPLPERTQRLFAEAAQLGPVEALQRFVENALADETVRTRPELVDEVLLYRTANPPDPGGWQSQLAASLGHDALDRLEGIEVPTLVVTGTSDNVVDHRNSTLIAQRIPGAQLELVDGGGHLFFWEQPERFAHVVHGFFAEESA